MRIKPEKSNRRVLRLSVKTIAICATLFISGLIGIIYVYATAQHNSPLVGQIASTNQAPTQSAAPSPIVSSDSPATHTPKTTEPNTVAAPTTPTTQPKKVEPAPKPAPEFEPLQVMSLMAGGDAVCDGRTYKLGIQQAYIFTNASPGTVRWQVEAKQDGVVSIIGSGTIKFAEGEGVYDFNANYKYSIPATGSNSATRLRITYPNDISSQWISPSEALPAGSPCAQY